MGKYGANNMLNNMFISISVNPRLIYKDLSFYYYKPTAFYRQVSTLHKELGYKPKRLKVNNAYHYYFEVTSDVSKLFVLSHLRYTIEENRVTVYDVNNLNFKVSFLADTLEQFVFKLYKFDLINKRTYDALFHILNTKPNEN